MAVPPAGLRSRALDADGLFSRWHWNCRMWNCRIMAQRTRLGFSLARGRRASHFLSQCSRSMNDFLLDLVGGSGRLRSPFSNFERTHEQVFSCGGGQHPHELIRTTPAHPLQHSHTVAFPRRQSDCRQERSLYGSVECFARGILLCVVGTVADRDAHRSYLAHACRGYREQGGRNKVYGSGGACEESALW
jgi:hypothetical protein